MSDRIAGWYGKMPALGDFARRRLPDAVITAWDEWLGEGITASRDALGDAWLQRYLNAPVWRFWAAPGVLDEQSWTGLMMASVDRVGRYFPLTVMTPLGDAAMSLATLAAARHWYSAIDEALMRCLDLSDTVERFEADMAAAPWPLAPLQPADPTLMAWWTTAVQDAPATAPLPAGSSPLDQFARLMQPSAPPTTAACTLWWHDANPAAARLARFTGLPPAGYFASLLASD